VKRFCGRCGAPVEGVCNHCDPEHEAVSDSMSGHMENRLRTIDERAGAPGILAGLSFYGTLVLVIAVGYWSQLRRTSIDPETLMILVSGVFALVVGFGLLATWRLVRPSLIGSVRLEFILMAAAGAFVSVIVSLLYGAWIRTLVNVEGLESVRMLGLGELPQLAQLVLICVMPAVFEEIAIRGILFDIMRTFLRPSPVVIVTSAAFSILHFSIVLFPFYFAFGLALGWLRSRSGSLWPSIGFHFMHNLVLWILESL